MEGQTELRDNTSVSFQILRGLVLVVSCLSYFFVYFHRSVTSALGLNIATSYGLEVADLSIFSSIYFYPYGVLQFFAGILADVIEPAFLVGGSQLLAAVGAVICGFSKNLGIGCFGRVLVGLGCGPTYVPCTRMLLNWFPAQHYATLIGVLAGIACTGGIVAARPIVSLAQAIDEADLSVEGWRVGFWLMAGIAAVVAILCLIFIRGHPNAKGFQGPNGEMPTAADVTIGQRFVQLWANLKIVAHRWDFWVVVVYCIIGNAPMFSFTAFWQIAYLKTFFGYSQAVAADTAIGTTVGIIIGSFGFGPLSGVLKTRKWVCVAVCIASAVVSLIFLLIGQDVLGNGPVWIFLIWFGATTIAIPGVAYPLVREYFPPAQAGTAVGVANSCGFLSTAVYQEISTAIIKGQGAGEVAGTYTAKGYRYGLWLLFLISFVVSAILMSIVRDSNIWDETEKKEEAAGPEPSKQEAAEDDGDDKPAL
jgi:sugar phosphate permease